MAERVCSHEPSRVSIRVFGDWFVDSRLLDLRPQDSIDVDWLRLRLLLGEKEVVGFGLPALTTGTASRPTCASGSPDSCGSRRIGCSSRRPHLPSPPCYASRVS